MYLSLPYLGPTSDKLKIDLEKVTLKYFPFIKLHCVFVNPCTLASLFRYKDVLPSSMRSSVIYKYCCPQCGSGCYIGSTIRPLYMRISDHAGKSFRTGNLLKVPGHSAIRDHAINCSKSVKPEDFQIIGSEKNSTHLRMLESLFIKDFKPNLNDMNSSFPLMIV